MNILTRKQISKPENNACAPEGNWGVYSIMLSQFGLAFCFNVVMSFMPFYIIRVSPYTSAETMIWIGMIMGLNSFLTALVAPFWGSLTSKFRPKLLFQIPFLCSGIIFLLMGFTKNLPLLLVLRLSQGALGGASTVGLFMITRILPTDRLPGNLSLFQNSMTAGSLLGPPVGAYLAAHLGYHAPFLFSFSMVGITLLLCQIYVEDIEKSERKKRNWKIAFNKGIIWGWVLSFIATIHLTFLPSILPHVLELFGLVGADALKSAGFIMMGYTATAIFGSYIISRLTPMSKLAGVIVAACIVASTFQVLLFLPHGVVSFAAIRMLQTGVIAAVIPLVMANFGSEMGGREIGFLNSARFAGNGSGPLLATSVLARSNLLTLYLLIAGLTVCAVTVFWATKKSDT
jgi:DHA1 family multidrug resistance protein-like MFS transporter